MALWATIDTEGQRKTEPLFAWVQEWYLKLEGPWGSVVGGRALDLFSRGASQNDYMYLHGYGLGFPGNVEANPNGSAAGLIGFGVMAAFYSTGIAYATPNRFPLQNTIGVYDPTPLPGGWEGDPLSARRGRADVRHDDARAQAAPVRQRRVPAGLSERRRTGRADSYGVGYGARAEIGNLHVGVAGHYGRGLGLFYALEPDDVSVSIVHVRAAHVRRLFGRRAVRAGAVRHQRGAAASRACSCSTLTISIPTARSTRTAHGCCRASSVLKYQLAGAAALVYHARSYLHFDIDYMRVQAQWFGAPILLANLRGYQAEHQSINFINAGVTVTW